MGSEVIVRQLLERMENVSIFGGYFGSPFIAALKGYHPIITELLLDRDIEVNHSSPNLGFALHLACAHRDKKSVQNILEHGADINTDDEKRGSALAAAASRGDIGSSEEQRAVVEILLRHEVKVQIRERDLLAAASWSDGQQFLGLFFKHDQSAVATELVIVKAIENASLSGSHEALPLLLERDGGLGTTPAMLKAARNAEVMKMLLKHKPVCQVTADVLEIAINQDNAPDLVKLLLTHDPKAPITGATIIAAMRNRYVGPGFHHPDPDSDENLFLALNRHLFSRDPDEDVLKMLLDRNRELEITDEMLEAAWETDAMEWLLQRRNKEQTISSRIREKAAKTPFNGKDLVPQLLKHDGLVKIAPPVILGAFRSSTGSESYLRALFEHDPTLEITQEDLMSLATGSHSDEHRSKMMNVLFEYGKTVEFKAEIRYTLDVNFHSQSDEKMRKSFYSLERRRI